MKIGEPSVMEVRGTTGAEIRIISLVESVSTTKGEGTFLAKVWVEYNGGQWKAPRVVKSRAELGVAIGEMLAIAEWLEKNGPCVLASTDLRSVEQRNGRVIQKSKGREELGDYWNRVARRGGDQLFFELGEALWRSAWRMEKGEVPGATVCRGRGQSRKREE